MRQIITNDNLREEARRLRKEQGYSTRDISQVLGVPASTVISWVRDIEITPEQHRALMQRRSQAAVTATKKVEAQTQARRLRSEGMSVKAIAKTLGVSISSASVWVRDIKLTEEQRQTLNESHRQQVFEAQKKAAKSNVEKHRDIRRQYQQEGREKAKERDSLHMAGCMLYWGEGAKSRNTLGLANSDPDMLKFYMKFLLESLLVKKEQIAIHITCYTGNGLTIEEIEAFWLTHLDLPKSCLRKSSVNIQPSSSQQKGRKLMFGVCVVNVNQTRLVHHVYGAIQEYIGIDKPEWLM